ncbi:MAG: thioredoxin family protein [Treponema sp.]|nr:thioredoxin family protein [Treponema sp.]
MKKLIYTFVLITLSLCFFACAKTEPTVWLTDYQAALAQAKEEDKAVLLFFSGDSWDGMSTDAKERIYNTDKFLKAISKDFIAVNIDIDLKEANESEDEELSDEKVTKYMLAQEFAVQMMPDFFIVSSYGQVVQAITYNPDEQTDAKKVAKLYTKHAKRAKKLSQLAQQLETTEGFDRVKIINDIYDNTAQSHRFTIEDLGLEVCELDPENKSGYLGKFKLQQAYPQAMMSFSEGDLDTAVNSFLQLTDGDLLSKPEKQEAFYCAAYLYAMSGAEYINEAKANLQKAYDIDPKSEQSKEFLKMIEALDAELTEETTEDFIEENSAEQKDDN